jgi:thiamine-monophosphate kinase
MSDNHFQVSDLGEKKLIKRIINKLDNYESSKINKLFKYQIGDDAALINITNLINTDINIKNINDSIKCNEDLENNEKYLVASSDLLIQDKHFPKQMSYFQMGQKSVTVNVSDLTAMGAKPAGILISLAIPRDLNLIYFDEMIDGILNACYTYGIPLIGGDTNEADQIIISGTAFGTVDKINALRKTGFVKGDYIAITGEIGLASLGFEILKNENINIIKNELKEDKISGKIVDLAIEKALNPVSNVDEGIILGKFASSGTDITDGLASELYELYNSNNEIKKDDNLGLRIYENNLTNMPNFKEISKISKVLNKDSLDLILHVGEDFEILFTSSLDKDKIKNNLDENIDFFIIGEVTDTNRVELQYSDGRIVELSPKGYEHFAKN